jgi:hypothetical protein
MITLEVKARATKLAEGVVKEKYLLIAEAECNGFVHPCSRRG